MPELSSDPAKSELKPHLRETTTSPSGRIRTRIIAVANQKGGVGKSTTAVSLGAALAELGYRVLVVDLDPQGNASTGLGIRHESREVTVYEVLASEAPVERAIVRTPVEGLFAIPSTIDLAGAEIELVSQFSRELRLRRALEPLRESDYDFIFLDCPPSLGLLTINALAAAEELIVPIQCEYYALEGLGQLLRNVRLVQQNVNPELRLTGIVMTMFDPRTKLSEQVVDEVRRYFKDRVYDAVIPRTVRLSEAPGFGQPITVYDPKSRGAECYRALAREVVEREPAGEALPVIEDLRVAVVQADPFPGRRVAEEAETQVALEIEVEGAQEADDEDSGEASRPQAAVEEEELTVETVSRKERSKPRAEVSREEREVEGPVTPHETPADAGPESGRSDAAAPIPHSVTVVAIDEEAEVLGAEAAGEALVAAGEAEEAELPRKRRWRLFRKGGDG